MSIIEYSKTIPATFGERLKAARIANGLTLERLAAAVGVTRPLLGYYERGERQPKLAVLMKLSKRLGVSLDYLVFGVEAEMTNLNTILELERKLTAIKVIATMSATLEIIAEEWVMAEREGEAGYAP